MGKVEIEFELSRPVSPLPFGKGGKYKTQLKIETVTYNPGPRIIEPAHQ